MSRKEYRLTVEKHVRNGNAPYEISTEAVDAEYDVSMFDWSYLVTGSTERLTAYAAEKEYTVEYSVTLALHEYDENGDLADWDLIDVDWRTRAEIAASILAKY